MKKKDKDLARREVLLNKKKCNEKEEKELRELLKKYPFGSRKSRLEAARKYRKGVEKLYKKYVGNK